LCEVSGGDDLDFAFPTASDSTYQVQPYIPAVIQTNVKQLSCEDLGVGHISSVGLVESAGEKIVSLRSLFKRAMLCGSMASAGRRVLVKPFDVCPVVQLTDNTTALFRGGGTGYTWFGDTLEVFNMFYLFSSGSLRYYYQNDNPGATYGTCISHLFTNTSGWSPIQADDNLGFLPY